MKKYYWKNTKMSKITQSEVKVCNNRIDCMRGRWQTIMNLHVFKELKSTVCHKHKQRSRWCSALFFGSLPHIYVIILFLSSPAAYPQTRTDFDSGKIHPPLCLIKFQMPPSLLRNCYWVCWVTTINVVRWRHWGMIRCGWQLHLWSCNDGHHQ